MILFSFQCKPLYFRAVQTFRQISFGLNLGLEAPVMTPNSVIFLSFRQMFPNHMQRKTLNGMEQKPWEDVAGCRDCLRHWVRKRAQGGKGEWAGGQQRQAASKLANPGSEKSMQRTKLLCQGGKLAVSCRQLPLNIPQALQRGVLHLTTIMLTQ